MAHAQLDTDFSRGFFAPITDIYPETDRQYDCSCISDIHFAQLGTLRALGTATTGQEFLQNHADHDVANIDPGHFFKTLNSARRLANLTSFNDLLAGTMNEKVPDPYAQCSELDGWDLYAIDGHYQKAACFDPKIVNSKGVLKKFATGHFFRMDMRTHHMSCLPLAVPPDGKKKVHDVKAIKRSSAEELRYGAPKGRKVMLIWDKACIDYHLCYKLKHTHGIYFLTLEKSNSAAKVCSANMVDRADPRNEGVVSEHLVGTSNGVQLRRIVYTNPEDGVTYVYLTSEFTLPAYQLVLLYKHRWDIEKIFHQFKSKLKERKSWASSPEAKQNHAVFDCLTHNLLLLFERQMITEEGLRDELEAKRKKGRRRAGSQQPGVGQAAQNFINSAVTRATQRTQRFIRWVAVRIYQKAPWSESVARLREHWGMPA
jgi:IS4 transposase